MMGILGGTKALGSFGVNPLQSNPLKPFLPGDGARSAGARLPRRGRLRRSWRAELLEHTILLDYYIWNPLF